MARIRLSTIPTLTTPPAQEVSIYAKADNFLYVKDSSGNEYKLLGSISFIGPNGGFLIPKISTALRQTITPDEAELFFDEDLKKYFGGDGSTLGGRELCYCGETEAIGLLTESGDTLTTEDGLIIDIEDSVAPSLMLTELDQTVTTENDQPLEI